MPPVGKGHPGQEGLNHQEDNKGELAPKKVQCQESRKIGSKISTLSSRWNPHSRYKQLFTKS